MRIAACCSLVAAILFAAACSTPQAPQAPPAPPAPLAGRGNSRTFAVAERPEVVYRKVVEGTRTCYAKHEIAADFFPDNRTGRVSMSIKTNLSIPAVFTAVVRPAAAEAEVQVFYFRLPVFATAIEQWANGDYSNCPFE